ncbi:MAG: NUDIX domain-containing protein [Synergistaceae bacterium]|jgi:8-oxo-dGTP diphosphatase|nr:NUDIX domain-containing protein [Synergistaceae bacterium]
MTTEPWDDYAYTALIVFCFLLRDGNILLIRRANEPYKGAITVPGGRKKRGENLRDACVREMFEETGYVLKHMEFAGILHAYALDGNVEFLSNYFVCADFEGDLKSSEEGDLLWVDVQQSLSLPGIHPFYVQLLPDILKKNFPIELSAVAGKIV